jgi:penicillin-binding protein 2
MAKRFGLGAKTGIDLPNEKAGLMPTRAWKRAAVGVPWQLGETLITGIGQGFVLTTPLQLAMMTARLANGGIAVTPHLMRSITMGQKVQRRQPDKFPSLGISKSSLDFVTGAMNAVTNSRRGTAYRARIKDEEMRMAGKSGTSQVRRITKFERDTRVLKNKERPWRDRDHALFVAFAPVHAPRFAAAVIVEHGGGGSSVAAPIVRDLLIQTQKRDPNGPGEAARMGTEPPAGRKA